MKYSTLKAERDDAIERAVQAERNSQLERVRELEAAHAVEILDLRAQIERLEADLAATKRAFSAAVDDANALLSLRAARFRRVE